MEPSAIPLAGPARSPSGRGKRETQYPYPSWSTQMSMGQEFSETTTEASGLETQEPVLRCASTSRAAPTYFRRLTHLPSDRQLPRSSKIAKGNGPVATWGGRGQLVSFATTFLSPTRVRPACSEYAATIPGRGSGGAAKMAGAIWMGTNDGLRVWNHGEVTIYGKAEDHESQSKPVWPPVRYVASRGLGDHLSVSVFADNAGRILVSTPYEFGYMDDGRFVSISSRTPGGHQLLLPRTGF